MPTHGSLAKAGKVRSQTPKIEAVPKKRKIPRVNATELALNEEPSLNP